MRNDLTFNKPFLKGHWAGKEIYLKTNHFKCGGYIFEGSFLDGLPSGKGKLFKKNKTKNDLEYEGGWLEGERHGYGKHTFRFENEYIGFRKLIKNFIL